MGDLRDRWLALEAQIPNERDVEIRPEVLTDLVRLQRDCKAFVPPQREESDDYVHTRVREQRGEALWVIGRIQRVITGEPLDESSVIPAMHHGLLPTLTRDEVIAELRADPEGDELRERLIARFAITEADLTNWMTVTISRDALTLLRARNDTPAMVYGSLPFGGDRRRELEDEIREALANATPEEDE